MQNESKAQSMFEMVEQWKQSGKSQKQFSTENDIKLHTFMYWVQKYRQHNIHGGGLCLFDHQRGERIGTPSIQNRDRTLEWHPD